jgi:hypothetical protein
MSEVRKIPEIEAPRYGIVISASRAKAHSFSGVPKDLVDEGEEIWIEEGVSATLGEILEQIDDPKAKVSFKKMRQQISKLLKITTSEEHMKVSPHQRKQKQQQKNFYLKLIFF